jgi:NAD(P)-dependent dehydrogenase (short-subunit alcohol dehydrogenase family)
MMKYNLRDKVIIITGASQGLGEQFAHGFAESGANVVLAARTKPNLERIAEELKKQYKIQAFAVPTDVEKEKEIIQLVNVAVDKFGTVDVLVNNAGIFIAKPLVEQTLDDWHKVMNVNLTSAFIASRETAKVMIPKKAGVIINISSTYGFGATRFPEVSYYASKGGIIAMTKALAVELGEHNIRVNAIAPGFFPTPMSADAFNDEELVKNLIRPRTALPMLAENEWIRGAACFLASEDAKYITGQTLAVDGGYLAF